MGSICSSRILVEDASVRMMVTMQLAPCQIMECLLSFAGSQVPTQVMMTCQVRELYVSAVMISLVGVVALGGRVLDGGGS